MKDYLNDRAAARGLAEKINTYWRNRGKPWVRAWVEVESYPTANDNTNEIYVIRSNIGFRWNKQGKFYESIKLAS